MGESFQKALGEINFKEEMKTAKEALKDTNKVTLDVLKTVVTVLQGIENVLSDDEFGSKLEEFKEFFRFWNNNLIQLAKETYEKRSEKSSNSTEVNENTKDL